MLIWQADKEVIDLVNNIKEKYHHPRLNEAGVAICFSDTKPFIKDRFNWGKTSKFSNAAKLWHHKKFDFCITLSGDAWLTVLNAPQREALLDLHLSRCQVEYEPVAAEENGKKIVVKDEWGRTQYTDVVRRDAEGEIKWRVVPLDLHVFAENCRRFGLWSEDLIYFHSILVEKSHESQHGT